jgi:arginine exporter protein ArgO
MPTEVPLRDEASDRGGLGRGLISGLLLAIPLWAGIGAGIIVFVLERPFHGAEKTALAAACVIELVLLRHAWRKLGWRFGLRQAVAGPGLLPQPAPALKRAVMLGGLAASYLHYYYWDVQTQIAMLPALTVFVPVTPIG